MASEIVDYKEIHAEIIIGNEVYLKVSVLAECWRSFLDWCALVRVNAGDRYSSGFRDVH